MHKFSSTLRSTAQQVAQLRFHIQEPGCPGYDFHYHLPERIEYVVGRVSSQCGFDVVQIQLQDLRVSRLHCRIFFHSQGCWMIEDLRSTNGTYIRHPDAPLEAWQEILCVTALPLEIDIRVGGTFLAMRPITQGPPVRHPRNYWPLHSRQAA
ncbi:MAG: FHA domain-containing protein [Magnetococcus sp. YQC-5]